MSTKINNAWKWDGDFSSFNKELQSLREDIIHCASIKVNKYLASKAYEILDHILLYKTPYNTKTKEFEMYLNNTYSIDIKTSNKDDILYNAITTETLMLYTYEKNDCRSFDDKDFRVSATIFPYINNAQLMMLYIQDYECYDEIYDLMEKHGFREYSYSNQVDCPESISEAEWKKRDDDWSTVFSKTGIPKYAGYDYIFFDSFLYETQNEVSTKIILPYAKPVSERAYKCAKEYLSQKALKALDEKELKKFSLIEKAISAVSKDEIKAIQAEIEKILSE